MADDLTPMDYAFLILLHIEGREISNAEMNERYGVRLVGENYRRLNAGGYVDSKTDRTPYRHAIAPKGAKVLEAPLDVAGAKLRGMQRLLWEALVALHKDRLTGGERPPIPRNDGHGLEKRIRQAYAELTTELGAWVSLSRLRPLFDDVSKADLDKALRELLAAPDVNLEPEPNQKTLTVDQRRAAVRIGGEDRHLLSIGLR